MRNIKNDLQPDILKALNPGENNEVTLGKFYDLLSRHGIGKTAVGF